MKANAKIWYGGDYNPDQWDKATWDIDFELFKKANVTMLTLPVFSWSRIQKDEESFDFDWLREILSRAESAGIGICLATSTAVQPNWLSQKYPAILPVDAHGNKRRFGGRVKFCPNSEDYKRAAKKLVTKMAEVSRDYSNIAMWHIGNEYDNYCYCDNCKDAFINWVKDKYQTVEKVNEKWYLQFWGHQIHDFSEIEIPDFRTENWSMDGLERTNFQAILLDYKRFMNESILSCYLNELDVVKTMTPDIPVTTNLMGTFKPLDYFKWAPHMDVISWDHYPQLGDAPYKSALLHDLMRSLKKDRPFWLMEQSPSQQNWAPYNTLKRPGTLRTQSYQTMARGADAIMYFQMRRSIANCEKFHGALIDHYGNDQTRVFKESQTIGQELMGLNDLIDTLVKPKVGIVFDWENWWAIEMSSGPSVALKYLDGIDKAYHSLYKRDQMIDFIHETDDLSTYEVIYAPLLYMVSELMSKKLHAFVEKGGKLVLTTFSGIVDANDHVTRTGYPGPLRDLAGIWVEEIDGLLPDMANGMKGFGEGIYKCHTLCDVIHLEGAKALGVYTDDFYKDTPVFTLNHYGKGAVYYVGSLPEDAFWDALAGEFFKASPRPEVIEKATREDHNFAYDFYINYGEDSTTITLDREGIDLISGQAISHSLTMPPRGVAIVKVKK